MKTSRPKDITLIIAVIIAALGLLGFLGVIKPLATYDFWLMTIGFIILLLGNLVKGL